MEKKPHKVMTREEYAAMPILGWHEVCRDVDGFGGIGVRFLEQKRSRGGSKVSIIGKGWSTRRRSKYLQPVKSRG
jgi:hypothetical protein